MNFIKKLFGIEERKNEITERVVNEDDRVITMFESANQIYCAGFHDKALQLIDQILPLSKLNNWKHLAFKGNVLEDLGKFQDAITIYSRAISWANNEVMVYALFHQIGFCYLSLGSFSKSEEFYSTAIKLKQSHPNSSLLPDLEGMDGGVMLGVKLAKMLNNRGVTRKNLKKFQEALSDSNEALTIDPYYANAYLLKGQILIEEGKIEEAKSFIKHASDLGNNAAGLLLEEIEAKSMQSRSEDPDVLLRRGLQFCDNGNYNEAIRIGHELLNDYKAPIGFYLLGIVYTLVEKYDIALHNCLKTEKYFSNVPDNLNRIGVCYCSLGNIEEGLHYFRRGMQLGDMNCEANYDYWQSLMD